MRKKTGIILIAVLLCTGCAGGIQQEETMRAAVTEEATVSAAEESDEAKESGFFERLMEQLDPEQDELLYERYQQDTDKNVEKVIKVSEIYEGSFTKAETEELLVLFRFCSEPPRAAGYDRAVAAVYDANTLQILAQHSFMGDQNTVHVLSDANGRNIILILTDFYGQGGTVSQTQNLSRIENGVFFETDPLAVNRGDGEFSSYDSYLSKYCVLTGDNTLLVFDISGTKSEEEQEYDLQYELKDVMKWSSDTGSFIEQ